MSGNSNGVGSGYCAAKSNLMNCCLVRRSGDILFIQIGNEVVLVV